VTASGSFSPREQTERIQSVAERDALELVDTIEELDVRGCRTASQDSRRV
jgi:hypothetical protein